MEDSNDSKALLKQGFERYRGRLERGDFPKIADACEESIRNVKEYITAGNIQSTETGLKIFRAMNQLILKRDEEVKREVEKLVA
jgi:hypothetical protein